VLAIIEFPVGARFCRAHVAIVEFHAPKHFPTRRIVLKLAVVHALDTLDLIEACA